MVNIHGICTEVKREHLPHFFEVASVVNVMPAEMLQKEFLFDIKIYFYSIKINLHLIEYIYMISKYIFIQSK